MTLRNSEGVLPFARKCGRGRGEASVVTYCLGLSAVTDDKGYNSREVPAMSHDRGKRVRSNI
jgi:hypothetical protein